MFHQTNLTTLEMPLSETLHHHRGSPFGFANRCILDFANAPSKSLTSLGTSDMPKSLGDMEKNK